jgi:hypothetical protein
LLGLSASLSACETSPIDAILPQSTNGSAAGSAGAATSCGIGIEAPGTGFFRLRSGASARCLASGDETTVRGVPAFDAVMTEDCSAAAQLWHLIDLSRTDGYWIRNVSTENNLDIETGDDTDGTAAVLFEPSLRENQRFLFRLRAASLFEIAPLHVSTSCLTAVRGGVEIWPCTPLDRDQEWSLLVDLCE